MNRVMSILVEAVRSDEVVGRGTCSVVDEAMTDEEVGEHLERARVNTKAEAVREMRGFHKLFQSRERDCQYE